MSRKLLAFLLSELSTVRVICKHDKCGVVTELPADQLPVRFGGDPVFCPHCRLSLCAGLSSHAAGRAPHNPMTALAYAIAEVSRADAKFDLEFVLADTGE